MNKKTIRFTKMHGLGNDFVVIDAITQNIALTVEQIQFLADRHFGVGCDQVLLASCPRSSNEDFFYRIFNANGTEVGQCGNGVRCLAKFVYDQGLTTKRELKIATQTSLMHTVLQEDGLVQVNMGQPRLDEKDIPVTQALDNHRLIIGQETFTILSMGNPHAVLWVSELENVPVQLLGKSISEHVYFPQEINVEFAQILAKNEVKLRVYERHCGETLACGSGACATVVAGVLANKLNADVTVHLPGGDLQIIWPGMGHDVLMRGPAVSVFEGEISH